MTTTWFIRERRKERNERTNERKNERKERKIIGKIVVLIHPCLLFCLIYNINRYYLLTCLPPSCSLSTYIYSQETIWTGLVVEVPSNPSTHPLHPHTHTHTHNDHTLYCTYRYFRQDIRNHNSTYLTSPHHDGSPINLPYIIISSFQFQFLGRDSTLDRQHIHSYPISHFRIRMRMFFASSRSQGLGVLGVLE